MNGSSSTDTPSSPEEATYFSPTQVARILGVNKSTVLDCLPDIPGTIRLGYRTIRIPRSGLTRWLQKMEVQG
jgi:hypothetical protein